MSGINPGPISETTAKADTTSLYTYTKFALEPQEQPEWFTQTERPPVHLLRVFPDTAMKMQPVEGEIKPAQKGLFG